MMLSKRLPRRTFLRGMGTAIALPFLEAMTPAFHSAFAAGRKPCRMAFVYVPNGVMMEDLLPETSGDAALLPEALPRILQPAAQFRSDFMVLSGLTQNGGRALGD